MPHWSISPEQIASLPPARRAELEAVAVQYQQQKKNNPLSVARLWHRDFPRTSQRESVKKCLNPAVRVGFILGGNRTGKSVGGAQAVVAFALGREHPDTRAWCSLNEIPPEWIPSGPGQCWAVALDSGDSLQYVRPNIARFLPTGSRWHNREGVGLSWVDLPGGGKIVFKTVDQGRDGFQGGSVRLIQFDEEPSDLGVYREALMRLVDQNGRMLLTMTPLYGWTPLLKETVANPDTSTAVTYLHGADNPHIPSAVLAELLGRYGDHEREAREKGAIVALEGRVYRDWDPHLHLWEPSAIPSDWDRFAAIDFGSRNPFCYLQGALSPDDELYLMAIHYAPDRLISEHYQEIKKIWAEWGEPSVVWADPEDKQSRKELYEVHGLATYKASKAIRAGINSVAERMKVRRTGAVGIRVSRALVPLITELEGYVWKESGDTPLKINDHAMDALRYLCMGIRRMRGSGEGGDD